MNLSDYQIVDLSMYLRPGKEEQRLELRRGLIPADNTYYHDIDTMSHVGTHIEAPLHFYGEGPGAADLPLETFLGEARLFDLSFLARDADVRAEALRAAGADELRAGDIVVLTSRREAEDRVHLTPEAAQFLAEAQVKMVGFDDSIGLGRDEATSRAVHEPLMSRNIPFLERLTNLEALPEPRFLLVALPWRVEGLDASPVRAVALVAK
ncbi:MAG: cyclase family protein [Armatimonadetes bacterium]|nr:cyclase family protein [Armatimonadota bacterium]